MATIDRLDVSLQVLPLLRCEVAIDRFILEKPVINLEIDEQGRPNWQLQTADAAPAPSEEPGAASTGDAGGGAAVSELSLGEVRISDGTLTFVIRQSGQEITVSAKNMELSLPSLSEPSAGPGLAVWNR